MFCPNCGHEVNDDLKFCPNCGAQIENGKVLSTPEGNKHMNEMDKEYELVSMVCGILSLIIPFFNIILGIIACVFSSKAKNPTTYSKVGKITGVIGIILGVLWLVGLILFLVLYVLAVSNGTATASASYHLIG